MPRTSSITFFVVSVAVVIEPRCFRMALSRSNPNLLNPYADATSAKPWLARSFKNVLRGAALALFRKSVDWYLNCSLSKLLTSLRCTSPTFLAASCTSFLLPSAYWPSPTYSGSGLITASNKPFNSSPVRTSRGTPTNARRASLNLPSRVCSCPSIRLTSIFLNFWLVMLSDANSAKLVSP